jgi:hypothetical protein
MSFHFPALSYMAAMRLAWQHLNERNNDVVSNMDELLDHCPDLSFHEIYNYDIQEGNYALAVEAMIRSSQSISDLCGMVGPMGYGGMDIYRSQWETALVSSALNLPQILISGGDASTLTGYDAMYSVGNFMSFQDFFGAVTEYLLNDLGIQYLAVAGFDSPKQLAITKAFSAALSKTAITYKVQIFDILLKDNMLFEYEKLKNTGIRIIFLQLDSVSITLDVANALNQLDMLNGDYFYILSGDSIDPTDLGRLADNPQINAAVARLLHGSLWIGEVDPFVLDESSDRFLMAWRKLNATALSETIQSTVFNTSDILFYEQDFFTAKLPYRLSSYVYDSIVALGLGKCSVLYDSNRVTEKDNNMTATDFDSIESAVVRNIVESVSFQGASGLVKFQLTDGNKYRDSTAGLILAAYSIRAKENDDGTVSFEGILVSQKQPDGKWMSVNGSRVQYADSTFVPPEQYVYDNMHYLSDPVHSFGISLFIVGGLLSLFCFIAITFYQGDALVRIAQPLFLKIICVGSFVENFTIFTLSFDENRDWSDGALDAACVASPWFFFLGHATIYTSIFCKVCGLISLWILTQFSLHLRCLFVFNHE